MPDFRIYTILFANTLFCLYQVCTVHSICFYWWASVLYDPLFFFFSISEAWNDNSWCVYFLDVCAVPPAYYAHLAAFRARFYMEPESSDSGSLTSGMGPAGRSMGTTSSSTRTNRVSAGGSVRPLPPLKENVKKVMFYCWGSFEKIVGPYLSMVGGGWRWNLVSKGCQSWTGIPSDFPVFKASLESVLFWFQILSQILNLTPWDIKVR